MDIPSKWTCSCCGKIHTGLPLDFAVMFPDYYAGWREGRSAEQIKEHSFFTEDVCTVEDEYYFVRGVIDLPLIGFPADHFRWGVWCSVSKKSFDEIIRLWKVDPHGYGPYFGWLNNALPLYSPSTLDLKTNVHLRGNNLRPRIELEETDHPLSVEQRNGITIERVQEIAAALLHKVNS